MCEYYEKDPLCVEFDNHVLQCEPDRIREIFFFGIVIGKPELEDIGFIREFL